MYIMFDENDNLIVQKLLANPKALGIFGFSFLDQNADKIKGASIKGVSPEFEKIAEGQYPISRSLYFYVKQQHLGVIPGIKEFVKEFTKEGTWGIDGYLVPICQLPTAAAPSSPPDLGLPSLRALAESRTPKGHIARGL